jgi:protein-tyrosine phosphatase
MVFNLLKRKASQPRHLVSTDIHSHLLPGIDDGVNSFEEAVDIVRGFHELGYKKLITTPHIMSDFYKNTPETINEKLIELQERVSKEDLPIEIEAAAEYYLDEQFLGLIEQKKPILTFGDQFVLFETSFTSKPLYLKEVVFKLQTNGYRPVLAHPERYLYLWDNKNIAHELYESGVVLQLNLNSISGHYSKPVQKMAKYLLEQQMITMIGSDCHNLKHFNTFLNTLSGKHLDLIDTSILINNTL